LKGKAISLFRMFNTKGHLHPDYFLPLTGIRL